MKPINIIGNGEVASLFLDFNCNHEKVIFASGVSNSINCTQKDFVREKKMLLKAIKDYPNFQIIYFSSCALAAKSVQSIPYYSHKLAMEKLIKKESENFLIFRLPQVFGTFHPKKMTLMNFIISSILKGSEIRVNTIATRYLIHVNELAYLVKKIITSKANAFVINLGNPRRYEVTEIIKECEMQLNKKAKLTFFEADDTYTLDFSLMRKWISDIEINQLFNENYLTDNVKKMTDPLKVHIPAKLNTHDGLNVNT